MKIAAHALLLLGLLATCVDAQPQRQRTDTRPAPKKVAKPTAKAKVSTMRVWKYWSVRDEMSPSTIHWASIASDNTVDFSFPYNGTQRATLYVRGHPKTGLDAWLALERGQFACMAGIHCAIAVRFDDGDAESYDGVSADDLSTTSLFISNANEFLARMQRSQRVRISATIYQEGAPVFSFRVAGYDSAKVPR